MLNVEDFSSVNQLLSKLDVGFILKIVCEICFYFVVLKFVKKLVEVFFSKLVSKISDPEIKRQYSTIQFLCTSILKVVIILFFATNILGDFGVDMKPILATAGVFGVAIGFGAKRFVEDVISGLQILLSGQLRVGDFVTVAGSVGTVEKINLVLVKIRAYNGDVHYVRNSSIEKVINHTREFSNPIVEIPLGYDADIPYVLDVLKDLGHEISKMPEYSRYILAEPEIVAIDAFLDSSILVKMRFKTTPMQQWMIQRKFRIMIKQKFDELNISIPFNQLDVHIKNEA